MKKIVFAMVLVFAFGSFVWAAETGNITVKVDGFLSGQGRVSMVLYNNSKAFPKKSKQAVKIVRTGVKEGAATGVFKGIPYGTYAFAILHDANANGKMDYTAIGLPTEGYAFSNNATGMVGAPSFKKASFKLDKPNITQNIDIINP